VAKKSNFRFQLEIDGVSRAVFQEVSMLDANDSYVDYEDGQGDDTTTKIHSTPKVDTIAFMRGIAVTPALEDWYKGWEKIPAEGEKMNAVIVMTDEEGAEETRVNLHGMRPVEFQSVALEGDMTAIQIFRVAVEAVEIEEDTEETEGSDREQ
jgi:phage tail-like protein